MSETSVTEASVQITVRGELADHGNRRSRALLTPRTGSGQIFYLSMQEDQQPNETWAQCRRDNRIPTVVSSASLGQFRHRRSRPSTSPWLKTKKRRGPTPGDHDTGFKVSSNNPSGKHRSMWRQKNTPHLRRGSASARDKSPTNPRLLVADNVRTPDVSRDFFFKSLNPRSRNPHLWSMFLIQNHRLKYLRPMVHCTFVYSDSVSAPFPLMMLAARAR